LLPFIFLTYSRAVWIGLVLGLGAMFVYIVGDAVRKRMDKKKIVRIVLGLVVLVVLGGAVLMKQTSMGVYVRSAIDPSYGSNEERIVFMARLLGPLSNLEAMVGRGLGDVLEQNFREVDLEVYDIAAGSSRSVQLTKNRTLVDNQYIKTLVEMGLVGLMIYTYLGWVFLKATVAGESRNKQMGVIKLWALGFLIFFIGQGLFIDIWEIFPTNLLFWVIAGLVAALGQRQYLVNNKE